ncbi:MAG: aminotransferase class IV [Gemmatimonadales bacterium]
MADRIAVFETMRVRAGRIPLIERHLERFEFNRLAVGLPEAPADLGERLTVTAGSGPPEWVIRFEWDAEELSITTRELPSLEPVRLVTSAVVHPDYRVKTTDREAFDRARKAAHDVGADEAILLTGDGFVAEGSIFAVGWVDGGGIVLPSLDLAILPSIGRARAIECAGELDIPVTEGRYHRNELEGKVVFIMTSVRGVVPVAELDGSPVPLNEAVNRIAVEFWPG